MQPCVLLQSMWNTCENSFTNQCAKYSALADAGYDPQIRKMDVAMWNPLSLIATIYNRWSKRKDRRAEAAAAFRTAFLQGLKGLYPLPSDWPKGAGIDRRLRQAFPALQAAVAGFRPFVPGNEKAAFDAAWLVYHTSTKREIDQDYTHYMNMGSVVTNATGGLTEIRQDGRANFKRNVDRLLNFAMDV